MRVRRRKVTIEISQFKLRVEQAVPGSPADLPTNSAMSDLAYSPPEPRPPAEEALQSPLLPPEIA